MKKILLLLVLGSSVAALAQKKVEISFQTDGVCGMCEKRIETALLNIDGVWTADWDRESHETFVVFNPKKCSEWDLHQAIADAGHDTSKIRAKDEDYAKVHMCCRYRDKKVLSEHENRR